MHLHIKILTAGIALGALAVSLLAILLLSAHFWTVG